MASYGIEFCDAGFQAAASEGGEPKLQVPEKAEGVLGWMGLAYHDGNGYWFGRAAEDAWFVQPRQVSHNFWGRLSREPSTLTVSGKAVPFSQLGFFFLRDYLERVRGKGADKIVFAVPGAYLKDSATEDEKVGLLLGMANELELPLNGIADMACAALYDPRVEYFDPALPVLVVDLHLHGTELSLVKQGDKITRQGFAILPQVGYAELLRHVTTAMGNRFLRHTTFDILEDGRIEQVFYQQVKEFLVSGSTEQRLQIATANRTYELTATREQLAGDLANLVQSIVQGAQALVQKSIGHSGPVTVAFTERTAALPGIAAKFRSAGFSRLLRLPAGASAAGAAALGWSRDLVKELVDVHVETSLPLPAEPRKRRVSWDAHLVKARRGLRGQLPTHAICEGVGRSFNSHRQFTIGSSVAGPDLVLPEEFDVAGEDCLIRLESDSGKWWLNEVRTGGTESGLRMAVEPGDRLAVRCGESETEVLFACMMTPRDHSRGGA